MSDSNPTPEERNRIVDAVMSKMVSKDMLASAPTELDQLRAKKDACVQRVLAIMKPIIDHAIMEQPKSPFYAHSQTGRAALIMQAHKLYVDELRTWAKEETLFMLSLEYADRTIENFL